MSKEEIVSNLDKIKSLCEQLSDRDAQLKVNAKTLWKVLDELRTVEDHVKLAADNLDCKDKLKEALRSAAKNIREARNIPSEAGCKKVSNDV